ncbi:MAG: hypothetical protein LW715_10010 [Rhodobacter sp.]|jgi:uncharacterized BrkB/YihY/UPF0761 family membrane protein|nr:hypothetical protein [Rhodobacter sp.]
MKTLTTLVVIIAGTIAVTALRASFPQADAIMLDFIDRNLVPIGICLTIFFSYCFYLIRKQKAKSR